MAALMMHPGHKLDFIERLWVGRTAWLVNAKKGIKKLWKNSYKGRHADFIPTITLKGTLAITTIIMTPRVKKIIDPFDQFMNLSDFYNMISVIIDEYRKYLEIPAYQCYNTLAW
jgi:hypothetical protein